jgi:thiamine-monophosphate kinase
VAALGEFELIARYFTRPGRERQGIGDDCALIDVADRTLALTTDLLVEGVHFFPGAPAEALGHKALAVNLSDLAAAGARPRCFLLGLTLPRADPSWLEDFSRGLFALADAHGCTLIGGDTTRAPLIDVPGAGADRAARVAGTTIPATDIASAVRGPLTISITAIGEVDRQALRGRSGARPGDDIWVSGRLGEAALGLAIRRGQIRLPDLDRDACLLRMDRPTPRVELGLAIAGIADAAIDVSDGMVGDLGHILARSGVGATVRWADVPRAACFDHLDIALQHRCVLAGGDDYELVFTAPPERRPAICALVTADLALTRIGSIESSPGLRVLDDTGIPLRTTLSGFDHFGPGNDGAA